MNQQVIKIRLRQIRTQLKQQLINCLIITDPVNVTYLTGFYGEDSWAVITGAGSYLITDSRYTEQAEKECIGCKIIERKNTIDKAAAGLINKSSSVKIVAVEKSTSLAVFEKLRKKINCRLKSTANIPEQLREIKDAGETALIKKSAQIAAAALAKTVKKIKPGITESELAGILDLQIRTMGAINSFATIVAFGPNASRAHHQPTLRKLKSPDKILIDFGAKYKGYCSDITRCFAVGKPNALYKRAYETVEKAQAAAIAAVKAGVSLLTIDSTARDIIRKSNLPVYSHGTGHGLGLKIHENPFMSKIAKGKLKAGQVVTIEPGIYMPGKLGVRIEDDVLITENGCKILTKDCPHLFEL